MPLLPIKSGLWAPQRKPVRFYAFVLLQRPSVCLHLRTSSLCGLCCLNPVSEAKPVACCSKEDGMRHMYVVDPRLVVA